VFLIPRLGNATSCPPESWTDFLLERSTDLRRAFAKGRYNIKKGDTNLISNYFTALDELSRYAFGYLFPSRRVTISPIYFLCPSRGAEDNNSDSS
jgi:hypothetical protein